MVDRSSSPSDGFFIPYPHAAGAVPAAYPGLRPLFAAAEVAFREGVAAIETHTAGLERIVRGGPGLVGERPARFEQEWFPGLDAAAAYAMVRQARPRRIIEIGSGHSTRFLAQAIVDGGFATDLACIDPQPRAPLAGLPLRHAARLFGPADALAAAELKTGDILFVDSSHVAMPGTDVDRLLLDVLPRLRDGVLVHFHDIFLPDAYPGAWARRGYNEQISVGALMLGGGYKPIFASHYIIHYTDLLAGTVVERLPRAPGGFQASLWLRKGGA
jgi:Methyltransferase domain